ncbi:MAG: hypothetical protein IIW97_03060 [Alistipes sp.]|nr:hypothetical protein [Alistipes sp.]
MNVWDSNDVLIKETQFVTDIPVHANKLTTIIGEVLTEGGNVKVTINNGLAEQERVTVVSSASHLLNVLNSGEEYILGNHIVVTTADLNEFKPIITRGNNETKTTIINLNGYTVTIQNDGTGEPVVLESGNTLIFAGKGAIEGTGALVDNENATVVVTRGVTVAEGTTTSKVFTSPEALKHVCKNGGEFTFAEDLTTSEILSITADNVVINGNGKTLTSTAGRAINVDGANNVTIKNLTIVASGERAINIINNATNVTIDNVTATAANYTVNVAASAPGAVVDIKNSTLNGLCTVNVASAGTNVTVDGSTVNCNDNNTTAGESYAALCLNKAAVGAKIIATNSTINVTEGSDSTKGRNGAEDGVVTIDGSDERVEVMNAAITYPGSDYYYGFETIEEAVEFAKGENEISLIRNVELTEPLVIEEGQIATINLNGKTITGSHSKYVGAIIKNEGTLTIVGGTISSTGANGGSAIQNNGQLIIKGTEIIGSSIREMVGEKEDWPSYPINNYGSSIIIKNATITGYQGAIACNTAGTVTLEDCTINKEYLNTSSHVFYINHEEAKVIVNGGTYTHIGMDGSLAYVIKGLITINGGTFNASNGGYGIAALTNGNVVINGGTFNNALLNWGGSISIKGGTFKAKPDASYLADGYKAIEKNSKYVVVPADAEVVSTADELVAALEAQKNVLFMNDIKIDPANMSNAYGATGINVLFGQTIDGNGYTLNIKGAGGTWDSGINTTGGLIKNLTITGSFRGIFINHTSTHSEKVILENVTIGGDGTVYTISCDQGLYQTIEATNCTFNGWTSYAEDAGEAKFINCSFGAGSGYKYCRPYSNTEFVNCTFCPGYAVDTTIATVTFTDCTWEE